MSYIQELVARLPFVGAQGEKEYVHDDLGVALKKLLRAPLSISHGFPAQRFLLLTPNYLLPGFAIEVLVRKRTSDSDGLYKCIWMQGIIRMAVGDRVLVQVLVPRDRAKLLLKPQIPKQTLTSLLDENNPLERGVVLYPSDDGGIWVSKHSNCLALEGTHLPLSTPDKRHPLREYFEPPRCIPNYDLTNPLNFQTAALPTTQQDLVRQLGLNDVWADYGGLGEEFQVGDARKLHQLSDARSFLLDGLLPFRSPRYALLQHIAANVGLTLSHQGGMLTEVKASELVDSSEAEKFFSVALPACEESKRHDGIESSVAAPMEDAKLPTDNKTSSGEVVAQDATFTQHRFYNPLDKIDVEWKPEHNPNGTFEPCDGCLFPYNLQKAACPVCNSSRDARLCLSCLYVTENPVICRGLCERCSTPLPRISFGRNPLYCATSYSTRLSDSQQSKYTLKVSEPRPSASPYVYPPTTRSYISGMYASGQTEVNIDTARTIYLPSATRTLQETRWDMWECWRCFHFNLDAKDSCELCQASANFAPSDAVAIAGFIETAVGQDGFYSATAASSTPCSYRPLLPTSTISDVMYRITENLRYCRDAVHETLHPFACRAFGLPIDYKPASSSIDISLSAILSRIAKCTGGAAANVSHLQLLTPANWMALNLPSCILNRLFMQLERAKWRQFELNSMLGSAWSIFGLRDDSARNLTKYSTHVSAHGAAPPISSLIGISYAASATGASGSKALRPLTEEEAQRVVKQTGSATALATWVDPEGLIEVIDTPSGPRVLTDITKDAEYARRSNRFKDTAAPRLSHAERGRLALVSRHQPGSTESSVFKGAVLAAHEELQQLGVEGGPRIMAAEVHSRLDELTKRTTSSAAANPDFEWTSTHDDDLISTSTDYMRDDVVLSDVCQRFQSVPKSVVNATLALSRALSGRATSLPVTQSELSGHQRMRGELQVKVAEPLMRVPNDLLTDVISTGRQDTTSPTSDNTDVWEIVLASPQASEPLESPESSTTEALEAELAVGGLAQLSALSYFGLRHGVTKRGRMWLAAKETWLYVLDTHRRTLESLGPKLVAARKVQLNLQLAQLRRRIQFEGAFKEKLSFVDLVGYSLSHKVLYPSELTLLAHKAQQLFTGFNLLDTLARAELLRTIAVRLSGPSSILAIPFPTASFDHIRSIPSELYYSGDEDDASRSRKAIWKPIPLSRMVPLVALIPPPPEYNQLLSENKETNTVGHCQKLKPNTRLLNLKPSDRLDQVIEALSGTVNISFETLSDPISAVYSRAGFSRGLLARLSCPGSPLALAAMAAGGLASPGMGLDGIPTQLREFAKQVNVSLPEAESLSVVPRNPAVMGLCFASTSQLALLPPEYLFGNLTTFAHANTRSKRETTPNSRLDSLETSLEQACPSFSQETPPTTKGRGRKPKSTTSTTNNSAPLLQRAQTLAATMIDAAARAVKIVYDTTAASLGAKGLDLADDEPISSWQQVGLKFPSSHALQPITILPTHIENYTTQLEAYLNTNCDAPATVAITAPVDIPTLNVVCTAAAYALATPAIVPYLIHKYGRAYCDRSAVNTDDRNLRAAVRACGLTVATHVSGIPLPKSFVNQDILADMRYAAILAVDNIVANTMASALPEVTLELNFGDAAIAPTHYSLAPFRLKASETFAAAELALLHEMNRHAPGSVPRDKIRELMEQAGTVDAGTPTSWVIEAQESPIPRKLCFELERTKLGKTSADMARLKELQSYHEVLERSSWVTLAVHNEDQTLISNERYRGSFAEMKIPLESQNIYVTGATWKLGTPNNPEVYTRNTRIDYERVFPYVQHPEQNLHFEESYLLTGTLNADSVATTHSHPFVEAQRLRSKRMNDLKISTNLAPLDLVFPPVSRAWYRTAPNVQPSSSTMSTSSSSSNSLVRLAYTSNPWPARVQTKPLDTPLELILKSDADDQPFRDIYVSNQALMPSQAGNISLESLPQQDLGRLSDRISAQAEGVKDVEAPRFYSRIRIRLTGPNSARMAAIFLGGFEIYGAMREPNSTASSLVSSTSAINSVSLALENLHSVVENAVVGSSSYKPQQTNPIAMATPSTIMDMFLRGVMALSPDSLRAKSLQLQMLAVKYLNSPSVIDRKLLDRGFDFANVSNPRQELFTEHFEGPYSEHVKNSSFFPDFWSEIDANGSFAIVDLPISSRWRKVIQEKFESEVTNAQIKRIAAICNPDAWKKHVKAMVTIANYRRLYFTHVDKGNAKQTSGRSATRYTLANQIASGKVQHFPKVCKDKDFDDLLTDANCLWGWHGTAFAFQVPIALRGFRREFTMAYAYGYGVYFAGNASYSASVSYAKPDPNGNQFMFLSHVAAGDLARQGQMTPDGHTFTSDFGHPPSVFVSTIDHQSIPLFIVEFSTRH